MRVIFQKKAKNEQKILKRAKNGEVFEDLGKNTQNLKIFCKWQVITCDHRMQ